MKTEEAEQGGIKSPKSPRLPLGDAIEQVGKLYTNAKQAQIKRESAIMAMGYKGVNGAALTTLSTLIQYGLLDQGLGTVGVSKMAIRILHPMSDEQKQAAISKAALTPKIFEKIFNSDLRDVSEQVLAAHLTQGGFQPDGATKVARIYKQNYTLAKLGDVKHIPSTPAGDDGKNSQNEGENKGNEEEKNGADITKIGDKGPKMLLNYTVPIGSNEATIKVVGGGLTLDDFDALGEFIDFAKKQFERKQKAEQSKNVSEYISAAFSSGKKDNKESATNPPPFADS